MVNLKIVNNPRIVVWYEDEIVLTIDNPVDLNDPILNLLDYCMECHPNSILLKAYIHLDTHVIINITEWDGITAATWNYRIDGESGKMISRDLEVII